MRKVEKTAFFCCDHALQDRNAVNFNPCEFKSSRSFNDFGLRSLGCIILKYLFVLLTNILDLMSTKDW